MCAGVTGQLLRVSSHRPEAVSVSLLNLLLGANGRLAVQEHPGDLPVSSPHLVVGVLRLQVLQHQDLAIDVGSGRRLWVTRVTQLMLSRLSHFRALDLLSDLITDGGQVQGTSRPTAILTTHCSPLTPRSPKPPQLPTRAIPLGGNVSTWFPGLQLICAPVATGSLSPGVQQYIFALQGLQLVGEALARGLKLNSLQKDLLG